MVLCELRNCSNATRCAGAKILTYKVSVIMSQPRFLKAECLKA